MSENENLKQSHASPIHGPCRGRWSWGGETYTSYGAHVPKEVIADDDQLTVDGYSLPPDDEVLPDLTAVLDPAVLPPGAVLTEPPVFRDKAKIAAIKAKQDAANGEPVSDTERQTMSRELQDRDERIRALEDQIATLAAAAHKPAQPASDQKGKTAGSADPLAAALNAGDSAAKAK
jgi:hypothetical protein